MIDSNNQPNAGDGGTVKIGDLTINRMGFGTMRLPGPEVWGFPANPEDARRVLRRAVELGVNYLDTAAYYGPLVSDQLIVEALYPYPANLVIGTKVGAWRGVDKSWIPASSSAQLKAAIDDNLKRLRLEQLHLVHYRYDTRFQANLEEGISVMAELQQAGKIRHVGISNVTLAQVQEAQKIVPIASVQNMYNLVDRSDEQLVDYCTAQNIPFMPFFPLAIGNLGRGVGALNTIAQSRGATPAQIAVAWLLARSRQMVLIPGTSSVQHLEENIAAASIKLSRAEQDELTNSPEVAAIPGARVG